jgi:lipoate-protein ligase B
MFHSLSMQDLAKLGVDVVTVPRGGETTYHGPGQLVAYPILNLRQPGLGARAFVEGLEDAMVQTVGCFGIQVNAVWHMLAQLVMRCLNVCETLLLQQQCVCTAGDEETACS